MEAKKLLEKILISLESTQEISQMKFFPKEFCTYDSTKRYIFACQAYFKGKKCVGMASSTNKDRAAFVAVMELVERLTFLYNIGFVNQDTLLSNKKTGEVLSVSDLSKKYPHATNWIGHSSNGVSIHTVQNQALENAVNELVERHTIIKALCHKISPAQVKKKQIFNYPNGKLLTSSVEWLGACGRSVVVIRGQKEFRNIYSFGAGLTTKQAYDKALQEFEIKLSVVLSRFPDSLKFIFGNEQSLFHWSKSTPETNNFFDSATFTELTPGVDERISEDQIWCIKLDLPHFLKSCSEVAVVKVMSPLMQQLFWGDWAHEEINKQAIDVKSFPAEKHILG